MFFFKVQGIEDELTKSEKKLVEYIKENLVLVKKYNVMDLAEKSEVSAPSIVRLAKKLGYSGFLDMKIDLNKSKKYLDEENIFLEKLLDLCKEKVLSLPTTVSLDNILVIAKYIKNSNKILLICEKDFLGLKDFIYSNLLIKGKCALLNLDYEKNCKILDNFKKDDVIFFLGDTLSKNNKKLLETYKENGLNTIFIGETLRNEERNLLDVDLDINLKISEDFFIYSLLISGIFHFI